jgi:hypothetical protein
MADPEDIEFSLLTQSERDILRQNEERWVQMGEKARHLRDWLAYGPGLLILRKLAMQESQATKPIGAAYSHAFSLRLKRSGLDTMPDGYVSNILYFANDPTGEHMAALEEILAKMTSAERSKLTSPITARQRVDNLLKERQRAEQERRDRERRDREGPQPQPRPRPDDVKPDVKPPGDTKPQPQPQPRPRDDVRPEPRPEPKPRDDTKPEQKDQYKGELKYEYEHEGRRVLVIETPMHVRPEVWESLRREAKEQGVPLADKVSETMDAALWRVVVQMLNADWRLLKRVLSFAADMAKKHFERDIKNLTDTLVRDAPVEGSLKVKLFPNDTDDWWTVEADGSHRLLKHVRMTRIIEYDAAYRDLVSQLGEELEWEIEVEDDGDACIAAYNIDDLVVRVYPAFWFIHKYDDEDEDAVAVTIAEGDTSSLVEGMVAAQAAVRRFIEEREAKREAEAEQTQSDVDGEAT